ncbi:MAG: agarase [Verrucomicrobia bacterium]|nr:agarase [Verrucomicrobiota bacterium]
MRAAPFLVTCLLCVTAHAAQAAAQPGFFRVEKRDGRWGIIDPDGKPFISKGVTTVHFIQDRIQGTDRSPYGETNQRKYGSEQAWREAAARRLIGWGFNTLGAWSDVKLADIEANGRRLAYTVNLDFGSHFVAEKVRGAAWLHGIFPDVFDPAFETVCRRIAGKQCASRKDDRRLLGWFTDNELRWGADWRGKEELLAMFLNLPSGTPGRVAAIATLRERYGEVAKFNAVWKTAVASWDELAATKEVKQPFENRKRAAQNAEVNRDAGGGEGAAFIKDCDAFVAKLAERYFKITGDAIKAADPNHMNFGCRFAYVPAQPVIEAAGRHLDGVSFNCYQHDPRNVIERYSAFGKPLIIGEFSFRGDDSGLPNTRGAGPRVKTQADRAAAFEKYVRVALSMPALVGYHWFEHADEPKEGRFDGENSNYGLVNINDEPYVELTRAMKALNAQAEALHATPADAK